MPGIGQLLKLALVLGSVASVAAHPKYLRPRMVEIRQAPPAPATSAAPVPAAAPPPASAPAPAAAPSAAPAGGLTDIDILQLYDLPPNTNHQKGRTRD